MKKWLVLFCMVLLTAAPGHGQESYLLVGTYNSPKSEGIYVHKFNSADGSYREMGHVKTSNPSFITVSPDEKFVYAVHEEAKGGDGGGISAFAFDEEKGELTWLNRQPTKGDHPCYVEVDKTGKWVFAGNYSSGSFSVFPVQADGSLGAVTSHIEHTGSGPNKNRQQKPHVHCTLVSPDNKWLFVPDLGIDKVMIYAFDSRSGRVSPGDQNFAASEPGAGPRHITFHPNGRYAYLVEELSGHVVAFKFQNGRLDQLQRTSSLPQGEKGFAGSADIHVSPDGLHLYASNRGDFNNIAMFRLSPETGKASIIGFQPTLGQAPRNFNLDPTGRYLLVGNQDSDEIVIFKRNTANGLLNDSGQRIRVGKPVCIKWISIK